MSGIVHFKFKSSNSYDSVSFDGAFVSVAELKTLIAEKKGLSKDATSELLLSDPRTQAEYNDDTALVPKSSSVLVRRVPASQPALQSHVQQSLQQAAVPVHSEQQVSTVPQAGEDDFGGELYTEQKDEDEALAQMLAQTGQQWEKEVRAGMGRGRGRGRHFLGRGFGREGFGREGRGRESGGRGPQPGGTLPRGYICYRCGQQGHHISDCPTNADPDFKRIRPAVGVPMVMLARNQEGGLLLPDGQTGSLQPNEDAFMKEMMGAPTLQKPSEADATSQPEGPKTSQAELPAASQPVLATSSATAPTAATTSQADPASTGPDSQALVVHSVAEPTLAGDSELFPPSFPGEFSNPAAMMFPQPGAVPPWDMHVGMPGGLPGMLPPMPFGGPPPFGPGFGMPADKRFQDAPLSKEDFQRLQEELRRKQERSSRHRKDRSRSSSRRRTGHDRRRSSSSRHRHHKRSRDRSRDKAPPRKIDLILRKDLEAGAGKSDSSGRRPKRSRRDPLLEASPSPRERRASKRSGKQDLHTAASAEPAPTAPAPAAAAGNGFAEFGDTLWPGEEFQMGSSGEAAKGRPAAGGKEGPEMETGKPAPSNFSVPELLDEPAPFQASSDVGDLRDLIQSRKRSSTGTTGLNSRLLRGVGSRWQPEKPADADPNAAVAPTSDLNPAPAVASAGNLALASQAIRDEAPLARTAREKQVDPEAGPAATAFENAEAPADDMRAVSPLLEAKGPLPKTFSIPVSPVIPADEEASERARRKAKKHKKEYKPKRSRRSHSQDAEAGRGFEGAVTGTGGAHATGDQPEEEMLPSNIRDAHLPGAASYDADGRPALVENANLATRPSHGASGEVRKQRREGSLFTRALAQAAMRDSPAAARDARRQARDGSLLVEPAAGHAVVPGVVAEQQYQGGKDGQEEDWGRQEWPDVEPPSKQRRHRHSRRDRAAAEGSVEGVAEEREASAERRERKEHKEHKRKHKHKHSKRKHQEA